MVGEQTARPQEPEEAETRPENEEWRHIPLPGRWSEVMDEVIEEAMRAGAFDNLPGRGKPLDLSQNPYAPGTELAYQLLKNNQYTLPWIAERKEILAAIDALRADIQHRWRRYEAEYRVTQSEPVKQSLTGGWRELTNQWQAEITQINRRINAVNLKQPGQQLEILKLNLENELTRAGAGPELT